jgi:UDP-3-O-[3-hydroxymyristoyl] glucosamine N-acyltransferase
MPVIDVSGFENCIYHHINLLNLYECEIGEGTKLGSFIEIGRNVKIGKRCKIQSFVFIPEGVTIGDDVFVCFKSCSKNKGII